MLSNSKVAEIFAAGETTGTARHMYIEGNVVYSYGSHFPIAERVKSKFVNYLFNSAGYSSTTNRHKSHVLRQLQGRILKIRDCNVSVLKWQYDNNSKNIEAFERKCQRAKTRKEVIRENITELQWQNEMLLNFAVETGIILEKI